MRFSNEAMNDRAVTHRYVSIIGKVKDPRIIKIPIGTSVKEVIESAGDSTIENYSIILGGPMMGKHYNKDEIDELVITKNNGAILVLPEESYIAKKVELI